MVEFWQNEINENVRTALESADKAVGNGYFAFSFSGSNNEPPNFIFHHFRPTPHAFLDAKLVGKGDVRTCLQALSEYIENFPKSEHSESAAEKQT